MGPNEKTKIFILNFFKYMAEGYQGELKPEEENKDTEQELHEKGLAEIDLGDFAAALQEHNNQFNMFRLAGESMVEAIDKDKGDAEKESFEERAKRERKESYNNLLSTYKSDLARTGLGLESVKSGISVASSTGEMEGAEMRVNVADGKKFLNYLGELDKNSVTESQAAGLKSVAKILTKQLVQEYNLGDPEDERMVEFMANFNNIVEQYQQFSNPELSQSVEELVKYLAIAKAKYLKEYLLAKREYLLTEPGIGAEGPQDYREKLEEAIENIVKIGKNSNAREFQQELIGVFKKTLTDTKKEFMGWGERHFKQQEEELKQPEKYYISRPRSKEDFEREEEAWEIVIDEMYEKIEGLK